jgi:staphylococcal nuclease domain-containing protein 1
MEEIGVSLLGSSYNGFVPKVGELCAALFSHDNTWYRARVRKVYADKKQAEIFYLDYGNVSDFGLLA